MNHKTRRIAAAGFIGFVGLCMASLMVWPAPANSEELRKFQLPSEKSPPAIQKFREPPVYQRFRYDTRDWTREKKDALITTLKTKITKATQARKFTQARHYLKLIQILQER